MSNHDSDSLQPVEAGVRTRGARGPECSDLDLARKCHLESIFHDKYIGDFEKVLGWQNLVVQTDTEKMSRML